MWGVGVQFTYSQRLVLRGLLSPRCSGAAAVWHELTLFTKCSFGLLLGWTVAWFSVRQTAGVCVASSELCAYKRVSPGLWEQLCSFCSCFTRNRGEPRLLLGWAGGYLPRDSSRPAPRRAAVQHPAFSQSLSSVTDGARVPTVAVAEPCGAVNYGFLFGLGFFFLLAISFLPNKRWSPWW